jgi:hypothetical protein
MEALHILQNVLHDYDIAYLLSLSHPEFDNHVIIKRQDVRDLFEDDDDGFKLVQINVRPPFLQDIGNYHRYSRLLTAASTPKAILKLKDFCVKHGLKYHALTSVSDDTRKRMLQDLSDFITYAKYLDSSLVLKISFDYYHEDLGEYGGTTRFTIEYKNKKLYIVMDKKDEDDDDDDNYEKLEQIAKNVKKVLKKILKRLTGAISPNTSQ